MKILLVAKTFSKTSGGAENHIYNLVQQLKKKHDFTIVTSDEYKDSVPGVKIIRLPIDFRIMNYIVSTKLKSLLNGIIGKFDLVHCHNYCCYFVDTAARIAKKHGKPLVITNHGVFPSRNMFTAMLMFIYNKTVGIRTWKLADKIISVSEFSRQRIIQLGAPKDNNSVIYNGIDLSEFEREPNQRRQNKRILYVGRIVPEKGLNFLVKSLSKIRDQNFKLIVAGDDSTNYARMVKKNAASLAVSNKVRFLGKQERKSLIRLYKSSGVFVLSSSYEPFGIVIIEAMAAGLPVIATRVGGVPEIVDGTRNRMVPYGNINIMAKSIEEMAGRNDIGKENRKYVRRFSIKIMAEKTDRIYSELMP
ncbi:MAG: glycosyltransferase family 4 protein [Candidatus Woesearchaeota archaeon]